MSSDIQGSIRPTQIYGMANLITLRDVLRMVGKPVFSIIALALYINISFPSQKKYKNLFYDLCVCSGKKLNRTSEGVHMSMHRCHNSSYTSKSEINQRVRKGVRVLQFQNEFNHMASSGQKYLRSKTGMFMTFIILFIYNTICDKKYVAFMYVSRSFNLQLLVSCRCYGAVYIINAN